MTSRRTAFSRDPEILSQQVEELARDLREDLDARPRIQTKRVRGLFVPPLVLSVGNSRPDHVLCTRVELVSNPEAPEESVGMSWTWLAGRVRVESIAGLSGGIEYDLTFLIIGGDGKVAIGG